MRIVFRVLFIVALLFALGASTAQAQSLGPDARYSGYPRELVKWPQAEPNLITCRAQEYYEPADLHLIKYKDRVKMSATPRVQQTDECAWMLTTKGWQWVLRPAGTKVAVDLQGRDLFDIGSKNGKPCWNPRPISFAIKVVTPQPVAETPQPAPAKQVEPVTLDVNVPDLPPTPPRTVVTTPPPPPAPQVIPTPRVRRDRGCQAVTVGVELVRSKMQSEYTYPNPKEGDVTQRHGASDLVPYVRYDGCREGGLFAYAAKSAMGSTSNMEFQDIKGVWNTKKRDSDDSRDELLRFRAGYKFPFGDRMAVGPYVGYSKWYLSREKYVFAGANTDTVRSFAGIVLGAEASAEAGERVTVNLLGEYGPSLNRKSWTKQQFGSIDFPRVDHPDEKARTFNARVGVDVKIAGPVVATAAYDFLWISSRRPENHAASEKTGVHGLSIGIGARFGWK